jgi:Protein of unknown function (DUF1579)
MKRIGIVVGLFVLVFAVSLWAQAAAPKPAPELNKFDFAVGHWTYIGEYPAGPMGPASKVTGELTINKILGGFFFQNQGTEKGPLGVSHVIEIFGYDPANKNYFSTEYHEDGSMMSGAYVFVGNTFAYTGKSTAGAMFKMTMTVAADQMSFTAKGEISIDGKTWAPFFEGKYTKTAPAPTTK